MFIVIVSLLFFCTSQAADPTEKTFLKVYALHYACKGLFPHGYTFIPKEYWLQIDLNVATFASISLYIKHLTKAFSVRLTHNGETVTDSDVRLKYFTNELEITATKKGDSMPTPINRTIPEPLPTSYDPFADERNNQKFLLCVCDFSSRESFFKYTVQRQIDPKSKKPFERW